MTLEPAWVEAIASIVTALIILGTAIAAFAQLRHGRNANDIESGVAERLVLAEYADTFVDMWEALRPWIAERRHAFGAYASSAFEHLEMRAKHYIDSVQMDRDYAALERDPRSHYPTLTSGGSTHA